MGKYDISRKTTVSEIKRLLEGARSEGNIYVIARIVLILRNRHCDDVFLSREERTTLLRSLRQIRAGRKVLANWIPIGYQTARFVMLARFLCNPDITLTEKDKARIKRAARYYKKNGDKHSMRQLESLVLTAEEIGLEL
jgi:hypothetical protein